MFPFLRVYLLQAGLRCPGHAWLPQGLSVYPADLYGVGRIPCTVPSLGQAKLSSCQNKPTEQKQRPLQLSRKLAIATVSGSL
jgi:hypothetical protein